MFGDIGVGIILSFIVTQVFHVPWSIYHALISVLFILLPDIDLIPGTSFIFKGHRGWTHLPLVYLPLAITLVFIAGPLWAALFASAILLHFIHDSLWIGNGIAWGWPFSPRRYKYFNQEKPYTPGPITWKRDFYLHPTVVSVTEYGIFIAALILITIYIF